ncbi:MAG: CHAD domain-containing protein [Planktothrix sp.]|uniref:CHAD domain-containing protein n=1 Tax=Planktothrix sp. TaxID=3088171 RepID=UPI0038D35C73
MLETTTHIQTHTLGYWAVKTIKQHLETLSHHESEILKDDHPEELHQMRVEMRRLRATIIILGRVLDLPDSAEYQNIDDISRRFEKLRDLDVLLEILQNRYYSYLSVSEQETLDNILIHWVKQRYKALRVVAWILDHKIYKNLKKDLKDWVKNPRFTSWDGFSINEVLPDLLLPQISELFLHPGWHIGYTQIDSISLKILEEILNKQGKLLHSLRRQTKQVRYQMDLFTGFYSSKYLDYLEGLKAIQGCLGKIQDTLVLEEKITQEISSNLKSELPNFVNLLAQDRYQYWQEWEQLRHQYLKSETRYGFHIELLHPVTSKNNP